MTDKPGQACDPPRAHSDTDGDPDLGPNPNRGRFITVEGLEGAGKSSQIETIETCLTARGHSVITTREPGGTSLGEAIRGLLLDPSRSMAPDAELLLVFAARAEHVSTVIQPALAAGHWVVSDRFTDATFAYQGAGRGISRRRIEALENWVQGELRPDLTVLLDLPVEAGLSRIRDRPADRFEREDLAFFGRIREAYLQRAHAAPSRYRIVDASCTVSEVRVAVRRALEDFLE